jgi:translation initiation factor IF-2
MTVRVYELSKKHGVTNKQLLQMLQEGGFDIQSHMAVVSPEVEKFVADRFKSAQSVTASSALATPSKKEELVEKPTITSKQKEVTPPISQQQNAKEGRAEVSPATNSNALKQTIQDKAQAGMQQQQTNRSKPFSKHNQAKTPKKSSFQKPSIIPVIKKADTAPQIAAPTSITVEAMNVGDFVERSAKPIAEVILALLKLGVVATKNQIINEKTVTQLAHHFKLTPVEPVKEAPKSDIAKQPQAALPAGEYVERQPVVVVVGHVDHGKTTLLDYIRKTRVASREKGGITQHLGAYEAETDHGKVVFLDTPGHEAFSLMRGRGIKIADIAILVVAADDGIMPQTIEAINQAKLVGLPIMVALNKIDKATPSQIEGVKRGLTQYDLAPEEWGGQTVVVPLSAKTGDGVNKLLELIVLQSQLMELKANSSIPARGFVLESRLEKGRGPVATVICQHGVLQVGDYFICGTMQGKVTSLVDTLGKRTQQALPSQPIQVAGFPELPKAGDPFDVVSAAEAKKMKPAQIKTQMQQRIQPIKENALNLIIKTDNASSKEAIINAIGKMSGKAFKEFNILSAGVGSITEGDVALAIDTNSLIYGLHTKIEPSAAVESAKNNVSIKLFDIIYQMLDDLHLVAEQGRPVKKVLRKIGEATILKVFDIKNLGVIAGAQVRSGRFSKDGKVVIYRGKNKVGEGAIKSLQRDRKTVKEVHTGFECAFMVEDFTEWQVDDRVECYLEMAENA